MPDISPPHLYEFPDWSVEISFSEIPNLDDNALPCCMSADRMNL